MTEGQSGQFPARYFDGQTSQAQPVTLRLRADALTIVLSATEALPGWRYDQTYNSDEYIKGRALILEHRGTPGAQLVINDVVAIAAILERLPRRQRSMAQISLSLPVVLALCVLAVGALIFAGWVVKNSSGFIASLIPYSWERPIGEALVPQVQEAKEYAAQYPCRAEVQVRLLRKLLARLGLSVVPKDLEILIDPTKEVNAFALPGNTILVNQGLIDFARNDQEILGVAAHEMGHLNRHHVMETLVHSVGLRALLSGMLGSGAAASIFELDYSRDHEREADQSAVAYLKAVGLSTNALTDFLVRIEERYAFLKEIEKNKALGYLMSHPGLKERQDILRYGMIPGAAPRMVLTKREFEELKAAGTLTCPPATKAKQ